MTPILSPTLAAQTAAAAATQMGRVHPVILSMARQIGKAGWRVSSILRPTGSHAQGIALDVCPLVWTRYGYGPITSKLVFDLLRPCSGGIPFMVMAEPDHLHIQLYPVNIIGIQYPQHPHVWVDPFTGQNTNLPPRHDTQIWLRNISAGYGYNNKKETNNVRK